MKINKLTTIHPATVLFSLTCGIGSHKAAHNDKIHKISIQKQRYYFQSLRNKQI